MFRSFGLAVAIAATLAVPAAAQLQVFGGESPRMSSMRIFWDGGPAGMVCVQYGQPEWKEEYDGMVEKAKGQQLRLGKDFWTTLNTSKPLTVGGTHIPIGSYYLGLKCDEQGGFHLMVLDAVASDQKGWTPFQADQWKAELTCPMTMSEGDESVEKLSIALTGGEEDPTSLTLQIAWGTHVLSAPVKVDIDADADADADGHEDDDEEEAEDH